MFYRFCPTVCEHVQAYERSDICKRHFDQCDRVRLCATVCERAEPCVTMCDRGQLPEWPTVKILELLLSKVGKIYIFLYI